MICENCNEREAEIIVTQIIKGKKSRMNFCRECARKMGLLDENTDSIEKTVSNLTKAAGGKGNIVCPVCGKKLEDILKSRIVGCPECYNVFSFQIKNLLKTLGARSTYTGSLPKQITNFRSLLTDRAILQTKLQDAIDNEEYEKAAVYRDKLKILENNPIQEIDND